MQKPNFNKDCNKLCKVCKVLPRDEGLLLKLRVRFSSLLITHSSKYEMLCLRIAMSYLLLFQRGPRTTNKISKENGLGTTNYDMRCCVVVFHAPVFESDNI